MELDSNLYIHPSDKAALTALKAIPGFAQVVKAFMTFWNEKQFKILNMSTNLRLSEDQMGKYYDMLPPICEKLGIAVPELYVTLDVKPNAYTYGDTEPAIVMTSGLFETIPDELIPTVLAHECGHIACHHTLYSTMGRMLLSGASSLLSGLGNVAAYPIQLAFAYWMRCSEYSADRAAMICDGNSLNTIEMCMRFAGCDKDIKAQTNVELFIDQAKEYRELVNENLFNKSMEFMMFQNMDHPLNAVRAYEAREWEGTERFSAICDYLAGNEEHMPIMLIPKNHLGKDAVGVREGLLELGFTDVVLERVCDSAKKVKDGTVVAIFADGEEITEADYYRRGASVKVIYFEAKTDAEIAMEHPGEILLTKGARQYVGTLVNEAEDELYMLGFTNITAKEMGMSKFMFTAKENNVAKILIGGDAKFEAGSWYYPDVEITIYYYVMV